MRYLAYEVARLAYVRKDYKDKIISVNLVYWRKNKKVSIQILGQGSHKEFLCLIQKMDNWMKDYDLKQDV